MKILLAALILVILLLYVVVVVMSLYVLNFLVKEVTGYGIEDIIEWIRRPR